MFLSLEKVKWTILDFSQGTVRVLWMCLIDLFILLWYNINIKMTQYNSVNVKLLNKWKTATKNETKVTLKLLANTIILTIRRIFCIIYY